MVDPLDDAKAARGKSKSWPLGPVHWSVQSHSQPVTLNIPIGLLGSPNCHSFPKPLGPCTTFGLQTVIFYSFVKVLAPQHMTLTTVTCDLPHLHVVSHALTCCAAMFLQCLWNTAHLFYSTLRSSLLLYASGFQCCMLPWHSGLLGVMGSCQNMPKTALASQQSAVSHAKSSANSAKHCNGCFCPCQGFHWLPDSLHSCFP
jgi:hypothetical protein